METIIALGAWNWMILAAVLFVLELAVARHLPHVVRRRRRRHGA